MLGSPWVPCRKATATLSPRLQLQMGALIAPSRKQGQPGYISLMGDKDTGRCRHTHRPQHTLSRHQIALPPHPMSQQKLMNPQDRPC